MNSSSHPVVGTLIAIALLVSAGCPRGGARVVFAKEGDLCRDASVLYLDEEDGDQLRCEDFSYRGPLSPDQVDEVVGLAEDLAEDGDLSGEDRERVQDFARNPPATLNRVVVPKDVISAGGRVWIPGEAERFPFLTVIDPETNELGATRLDTTASSLQVALGEGAVWVAEFDGVLRRYEQRDLEPVAEIQALTPGHLANVGSVGVATGAGGVWVRGDSPPRVAHIDPDTNSVKATIELPEEGPVARFAAGAGGVWLPAFGVNTVRLDPEKDTIVATVQLPAEFGDGQIVAASDAVWVVPGGSPNTVVRIDPATNQAETWLFAPEAITDIAVGEGAIWLTGENSLWKADLSAPPGSRPALVSERLFDRAERTDPGAPFLLALDVTPGAVWVVSRGLVVGPERLIRVDATTGRIVQRFAVREDVPLRSGRQR